MSALRTILGNERLFDAKRSLIEGKQVGLITNHSGVDSHLRSTADQLHRFPGVELKALFGPEHGIRGAAPDGEKVTNSVDLQTGVPIYSLYGQSRRPDPAVLAGLDLLLFDIQDVGARFYTYLYTMSLAMEVCAQSQVPFAVLDRPNPIGGNQVEGHLLDPAFASFVGRYPIPVRYGLTIGELALFFQGEFSLGAQLEVVAMEAWQRGAYWDDTGLPWVPPSPNMPTTDTATLYPGMCFFEGTNLSEGRGTAKPFEQIGAPYIDGHRLADYLNELGLAGVRFRPVYFQPTTSKYKHQTCQGIQVHITNRRALAPVRLGLEVLSAVKSLWPNDFAWNLPRGGIHNFDRLAGTDQIRQALDKGQSAAALMALATEPAEAFAQRSRPYWLYP